MALTESLLSFAVLAVVVYLGLKIVKNVVVTIVMLVILAGVLYYFGYLLPFKL